MLDIENKFGAASQKIAALRILNTTPDMQTALDEAEDILGQVTEKAAGIVRTQAAGSKMVAAASCLGLQLPIPDMSDALGQFIGVIQDLSSGLFFDRITAYLKDPDLAALTALKNFAGGILDNLNGLESVFAEFSIIQGGINTVLSAVSALIGCTDPVSQTGLGQRFSTIDGVLDEVSPDFKAGLDAVSAAQDHFSNPVDVLNDAKGRVTGALDLDGKVTGIKNQFQQARGWLG